MQVRLLGAHQGDNLNARFMSILIDGVLGIDAGGLTSGLSEEEQLAIRAMLITHRHFDHIKDLPGFTHARWLDTVTALYCLADTRDALKAHVFNGAMWPAMHEKREGFYQTIFHEIRPDETFTVEGYSVLPIEMSHTVPTVGYFVERGESSFFYTADTRGWGEPPWAKVTPDLLIAEVTLASEYEAVAYNVGHMTPTSLERELKAFHAKQGYYPRTVCVHINPRHEAKIRDELNALSERLGAEVTAGNEGMVFDL